MSTSDKIQPISGSVGSMYSSMLMKREEEKRRKREERYSSPSEDADSNQVQVSKEEKRQLALETWRDVVHSLGADDLTYIKPKANKKKYPKWKFMSDMDEDGIKVEKAKKKKKSNYKKEFEQELSMLRNILTDQNRFSVELSKRFQTMVGPVTKETGVMNKTAVELASAINNSRSNSLSMLREISNIKKTIANLTHDERKMQGTDVNQDGSDLTLLGSSLARDAILGTNAPVQTQGSFEEFDPSTWATNKEDVDPRIRYENTPTKTIVEYRKSDGTARYKTINTSTGEEITDFQNPSFQIDSIDTVNMIARDKFHQTYELVAV